MKLPNGATVDILPDVSIEINKWLQADISDPESGGFIVGYQHNKSKNVSLESVSHPYLLDKRSRIHFNIKDPRHKYFLMKSSIKKSFYMGVWHTHPQTTPIPSEIDWADWYDTLNVDKTACEYAFFIIAGTACARIWVGDFNTKKIVEIFECEKEGDLYI